MKRFLPFAIILLALAAGCASATGKAAHPQQAAIAVANKADADRLWSVALKAVSVRFPVKSAQEAAGTIESDYVVGPLSETGFKVNSAAGGDLAYDTLHTTRRRAVVTILQQADKPLSVCVYRERLVRGGVAPLPTGTFSLDLTKERPEKEATQRWVDEGRDTALEALMEHEIVIRYNAGAS